MKQPEFMEALDKAQTAEIELTIASLAAMQTDALKALSDTFEFAD